MTSGVRTFTRPLVLLLGVFLAVSPAMAGPFDNKPKILLHFQPPWTPSCDPTLDDCDQAYTVGELRPWFVYVFAAKGNTPSIGGVQFGIDYQQGVPAGRDDRTGLDLLQWTSCGTLDFPSSTWPSPQSGVIVTWDAQNNCQTGPMATVGWFYLNAYGADVLQITPSPASGRAVVASCGGVETELDQTDLGFVEFAQFPPASAGCNPCVEPCIPPPPPPPSGLPEAAILLHIGAPTSKNACQAGFLSDPATAVVRAGLSTPSGSFYFVYVLAAKRIAGNIAGLQCGITYESNQPGDMSNGTGIDIFSWTLCGDLEFATPGPNAWPRPGGGTIVTWERTANCQNGATAVAGFFYLGAYTNDRLILTPRPVDGLAKVANCSGVETVIPEERLGIAAFSGSTEVAGCNPWLTTCIEPVPVRNATWSGIKTLYAGEASRR